MLLMTLAALAAGAQPAPERPVQYRVWEVSAGLKAGCRVWQVHTPSGKIGGHRAIARCPSPIKDLEARTPPTASKDGES